MLLSVVLSPTTYRSIQKYVARRRQQNTYSVKNFIFNKLPVAESRQQETRMSGNGYRGEKPQKTKTPPKRGSKLVGERGFEPPTHWSQTSCATKLRYSPMYCFLNF